MAKKEDFDYEAAIQEMEIPIWVKAGFIFHINDKKLKIKSEKDLKNEFDKFMKGRD